MTQTSTHGFERMQPRAGKAGSVLWSQRGVRVDANDGGQGGAIWVNIGRPDGTWLVLAIDGDGQVHAGRDDSDREAAYRAARALLAGEAK